ncbi:hypothetical protein N7516_000159 [Penicillium verrucosum]|uniref:uncharacterized protein n=1 Tax=Penicillium verrucosum TaxID=60171 RepID=UPI0025456B7F|nr:uncharacterized protein N7516_000159 [Penicillium verrucosum]KAJ5939991.1 hypothetical protein N7516_000159 [Penicillium verrucosum]
MEGIRRSALLNRLGSLGQVTKKDAMECDILQNVCSTLGFFYFDLADHPDLLLLYRKLLGFSQAYFTQSLGSKQQNDHQSELYAPIPELVPAQHFTDSGDTQGYEAVGTSGGLLAGSVNGYESLKFAFHPPVMVEAPLKGDIIKQNEDIMQEFQHTAHGALMQVLTCLCGDEILNLHHPDRPSRTNSVFLRYPHDAPSKAVGHNEHNDMGTLTFLLAAQWGLQVRDPLDGIWKYVRPSPTRAVVNVGDSLNFISEGRLLSAMHRVIQINDGNHSDRYSIAFFLRPDDDAEYRHSDGTLMNAATWHKIRMERKHART